MDFVHNPAESRYEARAGGELVGEAHYRLDGEVVDFDHTFVAPRLEGGGVAGRLVRFAIDDVRASGGLRVRASCPYVAHWFTRHPQDAELLAE